jgi:hypothetical protein
MHSVREPPCSSSNLHWPPVAYAEHYCCNGNCLQQAITATVLPCSISHGGSTLAQDAQGQAGHPLALASTQHSLNKTPGDF